mmetsp:Transcript_43616/g.69765  ORF Transcript_43616/g.69765 Transcript_43616/m.69765 type:complete len:162 (-) Transcript_43616:146-631(-)
MEKNTDIANQEGETRISVDTSIPHPGYNSETMENDIALLKLKQSVLDVDVVPLNDQSSDNAQDTACRVLGWGASTEGGETSATLQIVSLELDSHDACKEAYGAGVFEDTMICASAPGKGSCQGDSGGPLFVTHDDYHAQIGVVSWGSGCAREGYPGRYNSL